MHIKKGRASHFFKEQTSALHFGPKGPNLCYTLMPIPSIEKMAATEIRQESLPWIILAKTESGETVEVATAARCSFARHPGLVKPVLMLRLLRPRIVERYPTSWEFEDLAPLSDHEGEPFIIRERVQMQEKMRDDEPGPSNRKR